MAAAPTGPLGTPPEPNGVTKADTTAMDDAVRKYLAFYVFTGFLAYIFFVTIRPALLPGDTLGMILGTLTTITVGVIGYYYQNSSSSTAHAVTLEKKGM